MRCCRPTRRELPHFVWPALRAVQPSFERTPLRGCALCSDARNKFRTLRTGCRSTRAPFSPIEDHLQLLEQLTVIATVGTISNMKAAQLLRRRIAYTDSSFAELVIWELDQPLVGSRHSYKYRLAYVVESVCVLRYDNEAGKGDHRHYGLKEKAYKFSTSRRRIEDFQADIARWNHENSNT